MIASCPELSMLDATSGFYAEGRCIEDGHDGLVSVPRGVACRRRRPHGSALEKLTPMKNH